MAQHDSGAAPRYFIPALGGLWAAGKPYGYPAIRAIAGLILIPHGYGKLFQGGLEGTAGFMTKLGIEPAMFFATYIGVLEFFGGILLTIGLLTRPVALLVAGFMAVAAFHVHWGNGFFWTAGGYEYPLYMMVVALAILFKGGGRLSVDRAMGKEF